MVVVLNCVYILKSTKIGYKLVTKDRSYTNCSAGGWLRLLHVPKTAIKLLRYVSSRMKIESHLKHNSFFCFHVCFRGMSPFFILPHIQCLVAVMNLIKNRKWLHNMGIKYQKS